MKFQTKDADEIEVLFSIFYNTFVCLSLLEFKGDTILIF